jgi:RNA-directed DNA polymerase
MAQERRGMGYQTARDTTRNEEDELMRGKAFEIPKELVWRSYLEVRKNRGAPGCDGQTLTQFDENRDKNLYKIWNRLSSGSDVPPPVREQRIPKEDGRERILGIPTVSDRIAQGVVKRYIEERLDPMFHQDSYGYRPGKSVHQALTTCAECCWRYSWVLEVDISAFFD